MKVIPCSACILGTRTHMPRLLANCVLYEERNVFNKSIRPQGHKVSFNEYKKVNNYISLLTNRRPSFHYFSRKAMEDVNILLLFLSRTLSR